MSKSTAMNNMFLSRVRLLLCALLLSSSPLLPGSGKGSGTVSAYLHLVNNNPLVCRAGYGQRGKLRSAGVEWVRTCKHSHFCWEATSKSSTEGALEDMKMLFDFPWVGRVRGSEGSGTC